MSLIWIIKMTADNFAYYIWRAMYVGIKPISLYLSTVIVDESFSNMMALSILISGSLMASLSFGSYKKIFSERARLRNVTYFQNARRAIFKINILVISFASILGSYFLDHNVIVFIVLFVFLEHSIHDESRIFLYSGDRTKWARHNCLRTLFIPIIPLVSSLFENRSITSIDIIIALTVINLFYSKFINGLFDFNKHTFAMLLRKRFYRYYFSQLNYFFSATINRVMQQSDKFLFSFISYEILWLYTIFSQIMSIPLMIFELNFMSELKAKIAKIKKHRFTLLNNKQINYIIFASFIALIIYISSGYFIEQLISFEFVLMAIIIMGANFVSAISMLNGERLFWYLKDASRFRNLEIIAFLLGHIFLAPLIMITGSYLLVKLPNMLSMLIKIRNSHRCLNS